MEAPGEVVISRGGGRRKRDDNMKKNNWIVAGPEMINGKPGRFCDPAWIQSVADQCAAAGVPFYDKRANFIRREFPTNRR